MRAGVLSLFLWDKTSRPFAESNYCTNHCLWATKGRTRWTAKAEEHSI